MNEKLDEFTRQLKEAFESEAREQIQTIMDNLIRLEGTTDPAINANLVELAFRATHNLKGSARAVNSMSIEALCHPLEDVLAALKRTRIETSAELLDIMLSTISLVEKMLDDDQNQQTLSAADAARNSLIALMQKVGIQESLHETDPSMAVENQSLGLSSVSVLQPGDSVRPGTDPYPLAAQTQSLGLRSVSVLQPDDSVRPSETITRPAVQASTGTGARTSAHQEKSETLKIPVAKLDVFLQKAEEMLSLKAIARHQSIAAQGLQSKFEDRLKKWTKSAPDIKAARLLMDSLRNTTTAPQEQIIIRKLNEILDWQGEFIQGLGDEVKALSKNAHDYSHATSTAVDILLDETKRLLMMPCSSQLESFPLVLRQLARDLGKEVDVTIHGGDVELDKRILAQVKDPLTHLLRNAVDHGLESPEEREQGGKKRRGNIVISVLQVDGSQVELRVSDDGRGINPEAVKESAIRLGILSPDEAAKLSRDEALALIFRSSLSTSKIVTEISGRGIGMAVVEENIRNLGGRIRIETDSGKGTTFVVNLPVTMATFRGVLVDVASKQFVVPTTSIDRVVRIKKDAIRPVQGKNTMLLGDSLIPLCQLEDVLQLPASSKDDARDNIDILTVAVLGSGDSRVGFVVDEVLEEQEVLVKSLGQVLAEVPNVSGVTILGSGKVVPILNSSDMLRSSRQHHAARAKRPLPSATEAHAKVKNGRKSAKRILLVDDTLTARILLRNIFESAGYNIKTANDGIDALSALKSEPFDAVVTDIEMPRMNGFELTEKLRQDSTLQSLPVIMVTSMTSKEDRERGVAVGANAYFVKSSFAESNLLDVISSLV